MGGTDDRRAKLAAALRANLRRRKARAAPDAGEAPVEPAAEGDPSPRPRSPPSDRSA